MATIKSFTDLQQSKKLAEILPLESADMVYVHTTDLEGDEHYDIDFRRNQPLFEDDVCAWSLAALLDVIREAIGYNLYGVNNVRMSCDLGDKPWELETEVYDNPIDACVDMIEHLYELKML
jgi:hypothetical protein